MLEAPPFYSSEKGDGKVQQSIFATAFLYSREWRCFAKLPMLSQVEAVCNLSIVYDIYDFNPVFAPSSLLFLFSLLCQLFYLDEFPATVRYKVTEISVL
jgi:hypothetical protein